MNVMDPRERRLIGAIAAGVFLAYMLLWWNSYFAPNNGGEIVVMNEYLHGRLPYRDWYSHQPPGMFFVAFAIARVFGVRLLPCLILGLAIRTVSVWVLYSMIAARRSPVVAAVASLVAAITSCTADSEYVGYYSHLSIAFLLFGALPRTHVWLNPTPRRDALPGARRWPVSAWGPPSCSADDGHCWRRVGGRVLRGCAGSTERPARGTQIRGLDSGGGCRGSRACRPVALGQGTARDLPAPRVRSRTLREGRDSRLADASAQCLLRQPRFSELESFSRS